MLDIYVDGDACPVKAEIFRIATRHDLKVFVVSGGPVSVPQKGRVERVRVRPGLDAPRDQRLNRATHQPRHGDPTRPPDPSRIRHHRVAGAGLAGTGLAGTGLAGTGVAGTGLTGATDCGRCSFVAV